MKEIRVVIDEKGNVQIEASGFSGRECLKETEALERALGVDGQQRKFKPEYFRAQQAVRRVGNGQNG